MPETFTPLRTLRDIEEFERVPLEQRIFSWNLNDWIAQGCARDPDKIALRYIADGDPDSVAVSISYHDLAQRGTQTANLFRSLGVGPSDTVLYVLPTVPELYVTMLGALAAGIGCGVNWMLKGEQLVELIRSTGAKVVVALGPTPGFEIWQKLDTIRDQLPPDVACYRCRVLAGKSRSVSDFASMAALQPGDRLAFKRSTRPTISPPMYIPAAPPVLPNWSGSRIAACPISSGRTRWSWRTAPTTSSSPTIRCSTLRVSLAAA